MAAKADIWMPLYIGDYLAATTHLSAEESGAYLHLLMHEWKNGCLPSEEESLRRIARVDKDAWSIAWAVLKQFYTFAQGAPRQDRLHAIRAEWDAKKTAASAKAARASRKRWSSYPSGNAPSIPQGSAQAMPQPCPSSSPSPSSKEQEHTPLSQRVRSPSEAEIELVRLAYPRRVKPVEARRAIRKAVAHLQSGGDLPAMSTSDALAYLKGRVEAFSRSPAGQQGEFTPYPATWFNAGSYLEDEKEWRRDRQEEMTHGANRQQQGGQQRVSRTPAQQRHYDAMCDIARAFPELGDEQSGADRDRAAHGPDEDERIEPDAAAWMGRTYPVTLDGNSGAPRAGGA